MTYYVVRISDWSADVCACDLQSVSEIALRSHLARGDVLYQQFQVAPALVQYRKADNLQRLLRPEDARLSAHLLLAIAGCELRVGHPEKAGRIARRVLAGAPYTRERIGLADRKSTRLNSSH